MQYGEHQKLVIASLFIIAAKKKALTGAERQRRYRARRDSDPEKRKKFLEKQRRRYWRDVAIGKKKLVKDLSPAEHRKLQIKWKLNKRNQRLLEKIKVETVELKCEENEEF